MIKKILIYTLCFVLAFSLCTAAAETTSGTENTPTQHQQGDMPQRGGGMGGGQRPQGGPGGDSNMQPPDMTNDGSAQQPQAPESNTQNDNEAQTDSENQANNPFGEENMPQGGFDRETPFQNETTAEETNTNVLKEYSTPIFSIILLAFAFVFVIFYKRKRY